MSKNIKTIIKALIIMIMSIAMLLILPKNVKAVDEELPDSITTNGTSTFKDKDIFCAHQGQEIGYKKYKITHKIEVSNDKIIINKIEENDINVLNFAKGILYITNNSDGKDREDNTFRSNIQIALWFYLEQCSDKEIVKKLGLPENPGGGVNHPDGTNYLTYKNPNTNEIIQYEDALGFYKIAKRIAECTETDNFVKSYYIEGTIGIYQDPNQDDRQQTVLIAEDETVIHAKQIDLVINKTDSLDSSKKLSGAKFNITLNNLEAIKGYSVPDSGTVTITNVKTNSNGQIQLKGIVPKALGTNIEIKIEETEAPTGDGCTYKKESPTEIVISTTDGSYSKVSGSVSISSSTATVNITNTPYITLSGVVWQDGQKGVKEVEGPNGTKDSNESGIAGVLVGLYNVKTGKITKTTDTNTNGEYSFTDIPKTSEGYKILFSYDGINWQETKSIGSTGTDSEAIEVDRTTFNNKFKTISKDQSNNGTKLGYDYNNGISTLKVTMDGKNPANENKIDFRVNAETDTYKETTSNINCGLVKKDFDLALGTDVKSATLTINEKTVTYNYAQIMNGDMEDLDLDKILQGKSSDTENTTYNLYLYKSDYRYRIDDYKTENEAIKNKVNSDDNNVNNYDNLSALEAYVTYSVFLKNQTTYNATVNKFAYYYDSKYEPTFKAGDIINDYKVDSIGNNKIILLSNGNNELASENDYRKEIDLTFRVKKDENNNNNIITGDFTNVAEILEYSTEIGGLIDSDSAPENANVTFENGSLKIERYEDDTDEANGITISIPETKSRTIKGTVWDDGKFNTADGIINKDADGNMTEDAVNDVIVQLIEIKKISGKYYEYIWQETRSGSNEVKTTARNGYSGTTYINSVTPGSGEYEFTDYIPGNYIIRFIYGDGSTYDITSEEYKSSADNIKKYNGQDYKSTIDTKYEKQWYNTAGYESGYSVARDNEARRLEVMAYSTTIDKTNGEALERRDKEDLSNTWMCAETSRINVPVDADDKSSINDATTASYDYITNNKIVEFDNMNFGLALRPETKLVLEKHITGLKITPSGTGVQSIIDARANIEEIIKGSNSGDVTGGTVEAQGVTEGLAIIKSTRDNRGFWQVATDVEELAQGAELEVEYTYVIRNDGEKDYLSTDLVKAYENPEAKAYNEILGEAKDAVITTMKDGTYSYSNNNKIGIYLGQYYYKKQTSGCAEVTTRVETMEEALNNDLTFDNTVTTKDFETANDETVKQSVYDTNGNLNENKDIKVIVKNTSPTSFLKVSNTNADGKQEYNTDDGRITADYTKTIKLTTVLSSTSGGELGANLPSYIAEIVQYSNAAGRRDMKAEPENLSYVHSDDTDMTLANSWLYEKDGKTYETQDKDSIPEEAINIREANEHDEFWGESIIITKPTGEDKLSPMQIAIITVSAVATLGVGIVLIKKFVLKK